MKATQNKAMEAKRFVGALHEVQTLQEQAVLKGIHTFNVDFHYYKSDPELGDEPDELFLSVTVFRTGEDDVDDDYGRFEFWERQDAATWFRTLCNLKSFVENV